MGSGTGWRADRAVPMHRAHREGVATPAAADAVQALASRLAPMVLSNRKGRVALNQAESHRPCAARSKPSRQAGDTLSTMTAINIRAVLTSTKLDLPELAPLIGHRVELTIRDDTGASWPEGWFEAVEGSIQDSSFERAPQPPLRRGCRSTRDVPSRHEHVYCVPSAQAFPVVSRPRLLQPAARDRGGGFSRFSIPLQTTAIVGQARARAMA